ncbi:hypothetical protein WICPIJ_003535 [Wickerhamomyces pijperi]|uniref:LCCL domain-containing protein n=1 Tax=Wickerhamomyces pijperi TaxID=599730 RepID=A0A9P8TMX3_WICPI|nr:hypothetical protein WICPIJ_003535 [Wickerhamomyces pijperi]
MEFRDLERELDERLLQSQQSMARIPTDETLTDHPNSSSSTSDLGYQIIEGDVEASGRPKTPSSIHESQINAVEERLHIYESLSTNPLVRLFQRFWRGPLVIRDKPPTPFNTTLLTLETFPSKIRSRVGSTKYQMGVFSYLVLWYGLIYALLYPSFKAVTRTHTGEEVISLSCSGAGYFWSGKNSQCGLDGDDCVKHIFDSEDEETKDVFVKCPALCDKGWTYSSTPVGDQMVKYRQYVIGGGAIEHNEGAPEDLTHSYRGDSFPCDAAVHSGVLSPFLGGCIKMRFSKTEGLSFKSQNGKYDTGFSIPFDSFFPLSFILRQITSGEITGPCYDLRLVVLLLNIVIGLPFTYLTTGLCSFWVNSITGFWTIILTLDPPVTTTAADQSSVSALVSIGFERLLPLLFVLYVIWHTTVKTTLDELDGDGTSVLARCLCWYPLYWMGVANNITFDRLPVDRLTPHDIKEQPGALFTVSLLILLLVLGILIQGFAIWKADKHRHYIKLYALIIGSLTALAFLPGLELRVHHYILGMMLVLGTSTKGVSAFLLQGVLIGLLISGVARWDFASILETHISLLRGEAGVSSKPPTDLKYDNGVVSWTAPELSTERIGDLKGYSVLINDVEVYVGKNLSLSMESFIESEQFLRKFITKALATSESVPLYVRVARSSLETNRRGDYTRAGVLTWPSGQWSDPPDGVT